MIAFIDDHREAHRIELICKVLPNAPSTYRDHLAKRVDLEKLSARAKRDLTLKPEIERVFADSFEGRGARKVWRQMLRGGFACSMLHGGAADGRPRPSLRHPRQTGRPQTCRTRLRHVRAIM